MPTSVAPLSREGFQELMVSTALGGEVVDERALVAADRQTVLIEIDAPEIEPKRPDRLRRWRARWRRIRPLAPPTSLAVAGDERGLDRRVAAEPISAMLWTTGT